ncbi:hypothetical protein Tco_1403553 [Tanacetum coccineum]
MDKKTTQSNLPTPEKPPMPPISSFSTGGSSLQEHTHQPMFPISSFSTVEESADEYELEEEARAEKELEKRIKQEQAHDELFRLEFGVKSDSEYESD